MEAIYTLCGHVLKWSHPGQSTLYIPHVSGDLLMIVIDTVRFNAADIEVGVLESAFFLVPQ